MKKSRIFISLLMASFLFSLFNTVAVAGVSNDQVQSQHIREADGTSGQNTNAGSGVKTGHIQNGAITTPKIVDNAITPGKIGFYRNVIIVAPSGGDFTNPVDAMNSITTDFHEQNIPYLKRFRKPRIRK